VQAAGQFAPTVACKQLAWHVTPLNAVLPACLPPRLCAGYLQRCLIKNLESLKVGYDCTVRDDCDSSIVQVSLFPFSPLCAPLLFQLFLHAVVGICMSWCGWAAVPDDSDSSIIQVSTC